MKNDMNDKFKRMKAMQVILGDVDGRRRIRLSGGSVSDTSFLVQIERQDYIESGRTTDIVANRLDETLRITDIPGQEAAHPAPGWAALQYAKFSKYIKEVCMFYRN